MRVGLRDLGCKWLRDVTVPKIFLLRHLCVFRDPQGKAVYRQSLVINPRKHEELSNSSIIRRHFNAPVSISCIYASFFLSLFLFKSTPHTHTHTHPQAGEHSRTLQRSKEIHLTPGYRGAPVMGQRRWILSYMIPPAHKHKEKGENKRCWEEKKRKIKEKVSASSDLVHTEYNIYFIGFWL